jgi:hypothetical protein
MGAKLKSKRAGRTFVYAIAVVPLLATLGTYFLEYVPSREEYFLNLRFRTLGVIGKQIEAKLESVSSGLTVAVYGVEQALPGRQAEMMPFEDYVSHIFPGLQSVSQTADESKAGESYPNIRFTKSADRIRFLVGANRPAWEDSLAHLVRPLTEDASFDDVLLAEAGKKLVLFQRSDSTPKLRELSELLKKPETPNEAAILQSFHRLHSDGGGSDGDMLREVDLDGSGYRLLVQPLTIRVPRSPKDSVNELLLCGLVRSNTIREEAMHVPPKTLLWIIVPLFAGLLSGPLVKIILIRRTGRFETRDLPMLSLSSCLAMAMLTVVLLAYHLSQENSERLSVGSQKLADTVAEQVRSCFRRGRQTLAQVEAFAAAMDARTSGVPVATNRKEIWSWPALMEAAPVIAASDLEFVFWTSMEGRQIEKWTPLKTNTPFFPQNSYTHFQQALAGQYWRDNKDKDHSEFTAELLISPTTSSPIAVLTMASQRKKLRSSRARKGTEPGLPDELEPAFVSIVESPHELLSPVIPPGMGFALVRRDGSVLYHSDHARILNENLFVETENSRPLVDAVTTQSVRHVEGRYRGSDVAFYVRPLGEVDGLPWTIVVFHEIEPWQTLVWQVGLDVVLLYLLLWAIPVLGIPAAMLVVKSRQNYSWRACRIEALRLFWPKEPRAGCYRVVLRWIGSLIVIYLGLLVWFARQPDGPAGTVLLFGALILPVAVLVVWTWQMRGPSVEGDHQTQERRALKWRPYYMTALALTLMTSSVLPVIAFFHLTFRMESDIDIRHWQWSLIERILKRRETVETDIRRPERLSPEAIAVALKMALPDGQDCDREKLYESWSGTRVRCRQTDVVAKVLPSPFWTRALRYLRWRAVGLEADTVKVGGFARGTRNGGSRPRLYYRAADMSVVVGSDLWDLVLLPRSGWWWLYTAILITAGFIWVWIAASRLFLFDFFEIPLRSLEQLKTGNWDHPLLVLGLPRSGKDTAVRKFIDGFEKQLCPGEAEGERMYARLDLKTEKLDQAWLKRAFQDLWLDQFIVPPVVDLKPVSELQKFPKAKAAVIGGEAVAPALDSGTRVDVTTQTRPGGGLIPKYVHVTNLEAALEQRERRYVAMSLLDTLVRAQAAGLLRLVVTSVVDPIFHYDIIFPDEKNQVQRNQLPETEFGRWSHVFLQFERVLAHEDQYECQAAPNGIDNDLWTECKSHPSLLRTGRMISEGNTRRANGDSKVEREHKVEALSEKAFALYKLLWSACTRPEKLLLVQVAQTGLVNPICKDTLLDLMRKRLVTLQPYPKLMNESFARFLESAASREQIENWEKESGESHWHTIRNVLIILLLFALLMIGVSQDHALQQISTILTAVLGGIGGVFKLTDYVAERLNRTPGSPPADRTASAEG